VEAELGAADQRPDDLFVRLAGLVATLAYVFQHGLLLLVAGRPRHGAAIGQLDRLLGRLRLLHLRQQRLAALAQQLLLDALVVAEQQRLTDADLEVVARLLEVRRQATSPGLQLLQALLEFLRVEVGGEAVGAGRRQAQRRRQLHRRQRPQFRDGEAV